MTERAELDYGLFVFKENFHSVSGKVNGTDIRAAQQGFHRTRQRHVLRRLQKINHVEHTSACAFAAANLDAIRQGTKRRNNAAFLHTIPPPQSSICRPA
jgi:hypothetical protein